MINAAKCGDAQARPIVLERLWPTRKGTPISFDLPEITTPADLPIAIGSVSRQVAEGDISPEEGSLVVGLLEAQRRAIEMNELAERVAELEKRLASRT